MERSSVAIGQNFPLRAHLIRRDLIERGCEALLVTKLANVRWLTGFSGSNGFVIVDSSRVVLVTDARYAESAAVEIQAAASGAHVRVPDRFDDQLYREMLAPYASVGVEAADISWRRGQELEQLLAGGEDASDPTTQLVPTSGICEQRRRSKDSGEIKLLSDACSIADEALQAVQPLLRPGLSEKYIACNLDFEMRTRGADKSAYDTIVASGPNSALPHARPTDRVLQAGDILLIDVGARLDGYGSDMTRTYVIGADPTAEQQRWYQAVEESQKAGVEALVVGEAERSVDEACREVLASFDLEEAFIHGTGHGIGLEIHEDPVLSPRSVGTLNAGLVITVEPGVYIPGVGGVRIEDDIALGDNANNVLTKSPKGLIPQT